MFIRGTDIHVPLTFMRIQPYVSPKIELSDQRQERVDVRVLPVIFRFDNPKNLHLYPGELVDVYVGAQVAPFRGRGSPCCLRPAARSARTSCRPPAPPVSALRRRAAIRP